MPIKKFSVKADSFWVLNTKRFGLWYCGANF